MDQVDFAKKGIDDLILDRERKDIFHTKFLVHGKIENLLKQNIVIKDVNKY